MEEKSYVLEMKHVSKQFPGVKALSDVDFAVRPGTVHALVGENGAGKSTLMKIIGGLYSPDEGSEIYFNGKKIEGYTPRQAIDMGISIIHQELSPILDMTISENIFLGQETTKYGFVEGKKLDDMAEKLLKEIGADYNPRQKMRELTVSGMQMIEITKAIFRNASLIIMDEPTSSLMDTEIKKLFDQINRLKSQGVGIIYISHKMDEIFEIADDITVMRDGEKVSSGPAAEYTMEKIVTQMVGRTLDNIYPKESVPIGEPILEIQNFSGIQNKFKDVSFTLRKGEILGLTGLVGAGRTELVRAIYGLDPKISGDVFVKGKKVEIRNTRDALKNSIAMVSEDRKLFGLVLCRSIRENVMLPNLNQAIDGGFINNAKEINLVDKMIDKLGIKVANMENTMNSLSGGNQQKVVLAKWLLKDVEILILDEPTRGIDVGAKHEIYRIINDMVKEGHSVIIISSEMPEIMGLSDRILVMSNGKITGELQRDEFDQEAIMRASIANL